MVFHTPKRQYFLYLIDTINARLTSWKAKTLSSAGRLILIKHVLSRIPMHIAAVLPIPISIYNDIERLMRNFLWLGSGLSTKINYVNWNLVCLPKSEGGLGIRKISEVNDACLSSLVGKPPLVPLSGVHGFKSATSNPTPFEAQQTQTMVHAFGKKLVASLSSLNREASESFAMANKLIFGIILGGVTSQYLNAFLSLIF